MSLKYEPASEPLHFGIMKTQPSQVYVGSADPHGGNLLATRDGRLVYLDFGTLKTQPVSVMLTFETR